MTIAVDNALASVPAAAGYEKSFTDFTVTLLQNVVDTLVGSSISQMKAYVDLVSELEKGLSAFKGARTSPEAIKAWLQSNAPETVATTVGALSQSSADVIKNLYATKLPSIILLGDLTATTGGTVPKQYTLPADNAGVPDMNALSGTTLTAAQIGDPTAATVRNKGNMPAADSLGNVSVTLADAVQTMLGNDAELSYSQLNTLIQTGLMRVTFPQGRLSSKLTYSLDTKDASERVSNDVYTSTFSGGGGASYSGRLFRIAATASRNQIRVKVATEKTTTSTEILATVMGEVQIDFRSDFFPALPSQAKA